MKYFSRVLELATYTPFYWLCKCEIHVCWILNKMWKIHFVILTYVLVILKKTQSILIDVLIYHLIRENSSYMWMRIQRNVKLKYLCHVSEKFQNLSSAYPNVFNRQLMPTMFDFLDIYTTVLSMVIAILFLFCFDTVKQIDVKDCNWYVPNKCKCFRIKKHYICLFIGSWAYIFNFNLLLLQ